MRSNPERRVAAAERRRQLRARAVEFLGGRCKICGYDACIEAMDAHHLDPLAKDFNLSAGLTSWKRVEKELAKCVLLCARCHREVHAGLHPTLLLDEETYRMMYGEEEELSQTS